MIVYKLTNTINGKSYIGQTSRNLSQRLTQHRSKGSKCLALHNAINQYGWGNFSVEILATANTKSDLDELESLFIDKLNTISPNGYNLMAGGAAPAHNEATKLKMSISHKGLKLSDAHRLAISNAHKGKIKSPEHLNNISKALKGRKVPQDAIQKMANAKTMLSDIDRRFIRHWKKLGSTLEQIGEAFNVSRSTVYNAVIGTPKLGYREHTQHKGV